MKAVIATTKSGVFAIDGKLPWRGDFYKNVSQSNLKELSTCDMGFFKNKTFSSNIVMGRKTWVSLKETPLKDRKTHYIITRSPIESDKENVVFITVDDFIKRGLYLDHYSCLIGGKETLNLLLPYCQSIYLNIFCFDETLKNDNHEMIKLDYDVFNYRPSDDNEVTPLTIREEKIIENCCGSLIRKEIHFNCNNIPWK